MLIGYDAWKTSPPDDDQPSAKCSRCSDPLAEAGTGPDGMCARCGLCQYCERPATNWQEGTDAAHCEDCWADHCKAVRVEIDDYVRNYAEND